MLQGLKSWLANPLTHMFGSKADTDHWHAIKDMLSFHFGPVVITTPPQGGESAAFFRDYILTGDRVFKKGSLPNGGTTFVMDMIEPVGRGSTQAEAVLALWRQMKSIPPEHLILRHIEVLDPANPHHEAALANMPDHDFGLVTDQRYSSYTHFEYKDGTFVHHGLICMEVPPERKLAATLDFATSHQPETITVCARPANPALS